MKKKIKGLTNVPLYLVEYTYNIHGRITILSFFKKALIIIIQNTLGQSFMFALAWQVSVIARPVPVRRWMLRRR